ncbi:hypothetical protein LWI29_032455 [Acer saccharum]|uniref:Pentatricopeptide repeat-containing protein n=1 Tax=Acer saccharum TaxID=4024 RepID=A0AA39W4S5_ACESA|nr:hypothetical protein LWI29_032455 [Acer saccharum]
MRELEQLHGLMISTSVIKEMVPLSKLIDFCTDSDTSNVSYAESVFRQIHQPSVYIWNSMIKGYSNSDTPDESLLYREMLKGVTHQTILRSLNVYVSTSLLNMYACCEDMKSGLKVFDEIPKWNVVAWTSLIAGYVNNDCAGDAIKVFKDMESLNVEPNEITLVHVLVACARSRDLGTGKLVHSRVRQLGYDPFVSSGNPNLVLATAIFDMYAKCGNLNTARDLFDKMPKRNLVAWNSMIACYSQYGQAEEAVGVFSDLLVSRFDPDKATFLSVISACGKLGDLALGQSFHAYVLKMNICKYVAIGTALVDMYAKSGDIENARKVFGDLKTNDTKAWMSMIIGLAMHGHGEEALTTFKRMQEDAASSPDQITYIGVLCACSHVGLVEEGQRHFTEMRNVYGIEPTIEHYGCMVDLLSRAGHFEEAERLVEKMPIQPNVAVWGALLNGCEIHENVDLADQVRSHIREVEITVGSGVYVLLSNIYANGRKQR